MASDQPVAAAERIAALDRLRGFAVLGILVMNVQTFAMVGATYLHPHAAGRLSGADYAAWYWTHLLCDLKFMNLFSILFGAGVLLMSERRRQQDLPVAGLHFRRLAWLAVIGLLHGYLIWYGDVLFTYAVTGMAVFWLRNQSPRRLILWWLFAWTVGFLIYLLFGFSLPHWGAEQVRQFELSSWRPTAASINQQLDAMRGSWWTQLRYRAGQTVFMQTFLLLIYTFWRVAGLMLFGMALLRWGVLGGDRSARFYATLLVAGCCAGLPVIAFGIAQHEARGWAIEYSFFLGGLYNYWASLAVSCAYIGALNLAGKFPLAARALWPLEAAGRLALTNYLMQSVICSLVFYGHGLAQAGRLSRADQLYVVLAIWVMQLSCSALWLRYFRIGPCEWVWRSLTYGRRQPLRWGADAPGISP